MRPFEPKPSGPHSELAPSPLIVTDATKSFLDHGLLGSCPDAAAPRGLYIVAARAH